MDLSILEQSPRLNTIYTQLCLCYALKTDTSERQIVETLTHGLEKLTTVCPWVSGQIVNENAGKGDSGIFRIRPWKKSPILIVKDHRKHDSALTMKALREAQFPFSMLDESVICPRSTLGTRPGETASGITPVLLLQANLIDGGLLLTVNACHGAMDIVGQGQIISLIDKACKGVSFTEEELSNGNLDRRNLIPLLGKPSITDAESTPQMQDDSHHGPPTPVFAELSWAYFVFSSNAHKALKVYTSSQITGSEFISTDDAICALIWKSIARARLSRLESSSKIVFTCAVDGRKLFGISESYPGNLATKTKHIASLQDLVGRPLGTLASEMRSALKPEVLKNGIQLTATVQSRMKDKSAQEARDRTKFVVMSSWTKVNCSNTDFGLGLGPPEAVRRPKFTPLEGVVYLLPKGQKDEIVAGFCLRQDDMEKLKSDDEFVTYAQYIG